MSKDEKHIMITGHLEYDAETLAEEYARDLEKGSISIFRKITFRMMMQRKNH